MLFFLSNFKYCFKLFPFNSWTIITFKVSVKTVVDDSVVDQNYYFNLVRVWISWVLLLLFSYYIGHLLFDALVCLGTRYTGVEVHQWGHLDARVNTKAPLPDICSSNVTRKAWVRVARKGLIVFSRDRTVIFFLSNFRGLPTLRKLRKLKRQLYVCHIKFCTFTYTSEWPLYKTPPT